MVCSEPTQQLLKRIDEKEIVIQVAETLTAVPKELEGFKSVLTNEHQLAVQINQSDANVGAVLAAVQSAKLTINDISTNETDLEDIFLQLTSNKGAAA